MREQSCPQCRWVAVVDGSGRRRMEMRWQPSAAVPEAPVANAA